MGIWQWFSLIFRNGSTWKLTDNIDLLVTELHYKKLAIETCIDLIANTLVRCEFQTFKDGKEFKGNNYYLFNISPNQNQNASEFTHSLVSKLVKNNECLVIMQNDQFYIADDFNQVKYAMFENVYKNVTVEGFTFNKTFYESDVFHFKLNDRNVKEVIDSLYEDYGKLITSAKNIYKRSNAKRVVLKGDFLRPQTDEEQELYNDMFDRQFKNWFEADNAGAVFQLQKGFEMDDHSGSEKGGAKGTNSRDIKALIDDVFDFVSMGFHIPKGMLKGDLADVEAQTNNYLMFAFLPIVEVIQDEFNRKIYKKDVLTGNFLKVNTSLIKILDIVDLATAADKFFAIGVNSVDDNLRMLGREPLNTEWSQQHYITKNYEAVNAATTGGGG